MLLSLLFIIKGCCPLPPTPVVRRPTCEMLREIVFGRYLTSTSLSERCKKNAKSSRQLGFNSMAVKDGRLRAAARSEALTSLSEWSKKNAKSSCQLGSKHPSPRFNSMAVKDGRLRALRGWKASGCLLNGQRRMPRAAASSGKSTLPHALE